MDPEIVAREMRRERDAHGERLYSKSEFLMLGQVSSFFFKACCKDPKATGGRTIGRRRPGGCNRRGKLCHC